MWKWEIREERCEETEMVDLIEDERQNYLKDETKRSNWRMNKKEGEMFVRGELVKCKSQTRIKLKLELKCTDQMAKRITI